MGRPVVEVSTARLLVPSADGATIHLSAAHDATDVPRRLELERGKSAFVRTDYAVKRVSVGNPDILDVVVFNPHELQFVTRSVGSTNVVLWDPSGTPQAAIEVHVGAPYTHLASELRRILDSPDIHVENAGNAIILKGSVPNAVVMEQAIAVASAYLGGGDDASDRIVNMLEVGGNHQVMIEVVLAEMSRSVRREFGTNFNSFIETNGGDIQIFSFLQNLTSPTSDDPGIIEISQMVNLVGTFFGFGAFDLEVFLDILDERGLTKILAEPTLVARSGESASFLAGGEVPIPIAQGGAFGSITIEFKKFGVGISFTPTVLAADRIHLQVSPEVSAPDFTFGTQVDGTLIPAFNTRRVSTSVELADGQSFAIAGLLREDVVELSGKYPILGSIPILGAMFRSSMYQKNETELVIIVTPHLVKPLGAGPHPLPTDYFIEPSAWEFYLLGALEGRPPKPGDTPEPGGVIGAAGHRVSVSPEEVMK